MAKPPTYERKALEKIWNVLQEIEEYRLISPENAELRMFFLPPRQMVASLHDANIVIGARTAIMDKLASLKAITIVEIERGIDGGWVFKIGNEYEKVFSEYEEKYGRAAGLYEEAKEAEQEKKRIEQSGINLIHYDAAGRVLHVGKYQVVFTEGDTNQTDLCRVIFEGTESTSKNWDTGEMLEAWGQSEDRVYDSQGKLRDENRRKVYHAAKGVNDKVFKETKGGVDQLLTFNTKRVTLTEKYRKLVS